MKRIFSTARLQLFGVLSLLAIVAPANAAPKIEFDTNFFNLGKVIGETGMSGKFKFKNTGDSELVIDNVAPSCDCTEAKALPDKLAPGESGEIAYTITFDHPVAAQRTMTVHCNDPKAPSTRLTMQFDFTPLYETTPTALNVTLPAGKDEVQASMIVTRKDGKAMGVDRLGASKAWVLATFDPTYVQPEATGFDVSIEPIKNMARVLVTLHRPPGPPGKIDETVELWSSNRTDRPLRTVKVTGEIEGELVSSPVRLYWVLADFGKNIKDYPEPSLTRHLELKSILGKTVEIKKVTTNIKGLTAQATPKDEGKTFDLVIKFSELPPPTVVGKIIIETSLPSTPILEVPVTINAQ